jgi:N-acetylglutamate synthase-like GNAT family acetyltransferase
VEETSIRRATTADLSDIQRLIDAAYGKYVDRIGRPPAPMTADYAAALVHSRVWVLERDKPIVGALVTEDRGDHLLLETVAVAPDCQGMGYGKMLLDRADRDAVELGFSEVRLYTNEAMTENLSFYPRHGYRETGSAVQDGFRRVYFSKTVRNDDVGDPTDANRGDHFEVEPSPHRRSADVNIDSSTQSVLGTHGTR